jgi:hypothetical protein
MSSEGSSSAGKWVIGCLIAAFLCIIVCAGGLFLAIRTGVQAGRNAARQAMQAAQEAQRAMLEQQEAARFGAEWVPPGAGAGPDVLFPEDVSGWRRTSHDDAAELSELGLSRSGRHAVYESGVIGIDLYVYEVGADEQSAAFEGAADAINAGSYSTQSKFSADDGTVHHMTFSFSPPERHGLMWWCKGWLMVFIADDAEADLHSFQTEYARSIQGAPEATESPLDDPTAGGESAPANEGTREGTEDRPD